MRGKLFLTLAILALFCLPVSQAIQTIDYGWEDGGTILGFYDNLSNPANVSTGSDPGTNNQNPSHIPALTVSPNGGSYMLEVVEDPHGGGTPQAYIAYIENLSEGDQVTVSFYGWDSTEGANPALRIWGHYALNGDVTTYDGSASGSGDYTVGIETGQWSQLTYTWTVAAGKQALVIEARLYSEPSSGAFSTNYWIDDMQVIAPDGATVNIPGAPVPTNTPGGPTNTPLPTDTPIPPTNTPEPTFTPGTADPIKINEVFFNSSGTDTATFVELYYPGGISLDGYYLVGINGNGGTEYETFDLTGYSIPTDGYFVVAQDAGVANYDVISGIDFQNGPDSIQLKIGSTVVDAIGYGDFTSAVFAGEGDPAPSFLGTDVSHSRFPDGADTDDNLTDFTCGNLTAGLANVLCAETPTPAATDTPAGPTNTPAPVPSVSIYDIQYNTTAPFESPYVTQTVTTQGVVTAYESGNGYMFMQDDTSAWNGILVYLPVGFTGPLSRGDLVEVRGVIKEYYTMTEFSPTESVVVISSGAAFLPHTVDCGDIEVVPATPNPVAESWEGMLLRVANVEIVGTPVSGEWRVSDMTGTAVIDNLYTTSYTPLPATLLDYVQGPLNFSYDEYKIAPRDDNDIQETAGQPTFTPSPIPSETPIPTAAPTVSIYDIQYNTTPPFESPYMDTYVITQGYVTSFDASSSYMFIQETVSPWNGILVYLPFGFTGTFNRGDLVEVEGMVQEYYGLTEISPADRAELISAGSPFSAQVVTCGDLERSFSADPTPVETPNVVAEGWEGMLVRVENVVVASTLPYSEWLVQDVSGAAVVDNLYYTTTYTPVPTDMLDYVQGPLNYSYDEYKIAPRDDADILLTGMASPTPTPTSSAPTIPTSGPLGLGLLILAITGLLGFTSLRKK